MAQARRAADGGPVPSSVPSRPPRVRDRPAGT